MANQQKQDFVVTDRRKFTIEGERRPDAPAEVAEESKPVEATKAPEPTPAPKAAAPQPEPPKPTPPPAPSMPETGYNAETALNSFGGEKMEFMHLLDMLVQTAMMYAGALEGGGERRVDIVGLRQMIDLLGVVEEKTRGNLTEQESSVLSSTLFQLRMTYMDLVNMIQRQATQGGPGGPGAPRK